MSLKSHTEGLREPFASKKFWSFVFSVTVMFGFAVLASKCAAMIPMFDAFVGGVITALGMYQTGNVMNKHVVSKNMGPAVKAAMAAPAPKPEEGEAAPRLD